MQCPRCQQQNRPEGSFCLKCGTPQEFQREWLARGVVCRLGARPYRVARPADGDEGNTAGDRKFTDRDAAGIRYDRRLRDATVWGESGTCHHIRWRVDVHRSACRLRHGRCRGSAASGFRLGRTEEAWLAGRHYHRTGLSSESQLYADATRASISSSTGMPFSPFVMAAMP